MTDQNRKTLRSFYCRDYLWEHFEQMAQELGCSMDYLINESMRLYARNRDQGAGEPAAEGAGSMGGGQQQSQPRQQVDRSGAQNSPPGGSRSQSQPAGGPNSGGQGGGGPNPGGRPPARGGGEKHETFQQVPAVGDNNGRSRSSQGGRGGGQAGNPGGPPPPPPRPGGGGGADPAPSNPGQSGGADNWQQNNQNSPPQPPGSGAGAATGPSTGGQPPLYLSFNNNRYVIDQQKYVIGRGSKHTDLTIRDGNISRKHCAIIYRNGTYYIKDLDSTNGVEYRGNRIESKKIEEGDVFYLCDYDLRFSFRG